MRQTRTLTIRSSEPIDVEFHEVRAGIAERAAALASSAARRWLALQPPVKLGVGSFAGCMALVGLDDPSKLTSLEAVATVGLFSAAMAAMIMGTSNRT